MRTVLYFFRVMCKEILKGVLTLQGTKILTYVFVNLFTFVYFSHFISDIINKNYRLCVTMNLQSFK